MQKEIIDKANKIIQLIQDNKRAVEELEKYVNDGVRLEKSEIRHTGWVCPQTIYMHFKPWEVRLIIHNKKQRIQALEKELEQL